MPTDTETIIANVAHERQPIAALLARWPTFPHKSLPALLARFRRALRGRAAVTQAAHRLVQITRADLRKTGRYLVVATGNTAEVLALVSWKDADRALRLPQNHVYRIDRA